MPNGFHGPRERWDRLEGALARLNADLRSDAETPGMDWRASGRGWPSRSLEWGSEVKRLIQLTLVDDVDDLRGVGVRHPGSPRGPLLTLNGE